MPPEPGVRGLAARDALGAWIRDPENAPPPAGIEPRRLKIYAELFYNGIEGMLAQAFPVIRATLGDAAWHALVRDFMREHPARTPLFTELARELLRYLESRAESDRGDPPWLPELAHYEWIEMALQISEASIDDVPHDLQGDLLAGRPALSPLAKPLAYAWPVHRIAPGQVPVAPELTLLLVRRMPDGGIAFSALSPLTYRLLQLVDEAPEATGQALLEALAAEAAAPDTSAFVRQGATMLETLRADGTLLGTRR
ncbi:HvfC family RiPP maturation protein [Lysobacter humi (ex Lee et al. 2017)]